ncbi:MAG: hypothetical protein WCS77_01810 [Elusimicrobiaceae bacterium]
MKVIDKLLNLDRRIIFLSVLLVILIPIIRPFNLAGVEITGAVKGVYDTIESLPPGSAVLVSFDYDPSGKPDVYPMSVAVCRHAFRRNLRVVGMNLWASGTGLAEEALRKTALEYGREYKKDYVYLGYQPQAEAVITQLGKDIYVMYPTDYYRNPTRGMPVLDGILSLRDFAFMVDFSNGHPGLEEWLIYGADKFGFKIACGCSAVSEPGFRPFLNSGQIVGLIGAMKGAAEYERLIGMPDKATAGMEAVSMGHFLILFLVFGANALLLVKKYF